MIEKKLITVKYFLCLVLRLGGINHPLHAFGLNSRALKNISGLHSVYVAVTFRVRDKLLNSTLLLEPRDCVFSLVPVDCFAVIDPEVSRSLINSVTASVFLSGLL